MEKGILGSKEVRWKWCGVDVAWTGRGWSAGRDVGEGRDVVKGGMWVKGGVGCMVGA